MRQDNETTRNDSETQETDGHLQAPQSLLVLQQNGSAEAKIQGIRRFGEGLFTLDVVSIDEVLPPIIDDAGEYLPAEIHASLVLDFLRHPDVSQDLAVFCIKRNIPVVASGKKFRFKGAFTPPT